MEKTSSSPRNSTGNPKYIDYKVSYPFTLQSREMSKLDASCPYFCFNLIYAEFMLRESNDIHGICIHGTNVNNLRWTTWPSKPKIQKKTKKKTNKRFRRLIKCSQGMPLKNSVEMR